ncbi:hypothetical protein RvY_02044-2 [Ramazzottius varieornatus]|uniref:Transporter n=1 Tax=Ramazzottius varieornatus TaxID=947166 RepID=A0A1D1UIE8_RAMVA|nr:hypothetical protein RvY_02044-2 [Ramazzottius varieornatus]
MAQKLLDLFKQRLNKRAFFKRSQTEADLNSSLVEAGQRDRRTEEQRETWTSRWEYYLSCLGYAIGLGNVWRFPYLAYSLGGGAFVIAYFAVLILVGIPLVLLELAIGQYTGLGPAVVFQKLCPLFGGLGVAIVVNQFLICTYYSMVVAWTLFYLFASFRGDVPWSHCGPALSSSSLCFSDQDFQACNRLGGVYNQLCFTGEFAQQTGISVIPPSLRVSSAEDYLNQYVLKLSPSISEPGSPDWRLTLCLALSWLICFLCLIKGIKSSGKVVWFTTIFPLICLLIFAFRGATLENALMGVRYFIVPDWNQLASLTVWVQAAAQVFFNLSVGGGGLITYVSVNPLSVDTL